MTIYCYESTHIYPLHWSKHHSIIKFWIWFFFSQAPYKSTILYIFRWSAQCAWCEYQFTAAMSSTQVVAKLRWLKHDVLKACCQIILTRAWRLESTIALEVWIKKRNFPEIQQETYKLQQTKQRDLRVHYAIENLNSLKSEITTLQIQLHEQKGKKKKLTEQIAALHKEVAALSFKDMFDQ